MVAAVPQHQEGMLVIELGDAPVSTWQRVFAGIIYGAIAAAVIMSLLAAYEIRQINHRLEQQAIELHLLQVNLKDSKERLRVLESERYTIEVKAIEKETADDATTP